MVFLKRIFLFLLINFLIITTISIILSLLNLGPVLSEHGFNYLNLMLFCLIWGMGGAFLSLLLSKSMAKWMMGVKTIESKTVSSEEQKLIYFIEELSRKAGLKKNPEIGIYPSHEINAFATGFSQNHALVAVSNGLLKHLDKEEIKAVLAHEISHIANGDMITMTLLQGIINAFVMFLARIFAHALASLGRGKSKSPSYGSYHFFVFLFQTLFMVLGSLVLAAFSRRREYKADKGGAMLAGKERMIAALKALRVTSEIKDGYSEKAAFQAFKISAPKKHGLLYLFATHPSLEERIERLENESYL
ncbi:MAG: protease HtpX [Parachlamydiales bacterium]|jgi:heat shock protein HtpX